MRDQVEADKALALALVRQYFPDATLAQAVARIRSEPSHPLRSVADWFDNPRGVRMTDADEYRDASVAMNRAALDAQHKPTLDQLFAWILAHARFARAQQAYPLSRPAAPVKRDKRVKAAVALAPHDFSLDAQAAIVEISGGDSPAGQARLAALVAEGQDPNGHIAAILAKVDEDQWDDVNDLAKRIARKIGNGKTARALPTTMPSAEPAAPSPSPDETGSVPAIDNEAVTAASKVLQGWIESRPAVLGMFREQDGVILFTQEIKVDRYREAYDLAGRSAPFQAFLREKLG